jgi:hypothetical protein
VINALDGAITKDKEIDLEDCALAGDRGCINIVDMNAFCEHCKELRRRSRDLRRI